jgi:hypothetical protein
MTDRCTPEQIYRGLKLFVTAVKMHQRGMRVVVSPEEEMRAKRIVDVFVRKARRDIKRARRRAT